MFLGWIIWKTCLANNLLADIFFYFYSQEMIQRKWHVGCYCNSWNKTLYIVSFIVPQGRSDNLTEMIVNCTFIYEVFMFINSQCMYSVTYYT